MDDKQQSRSDCRVAWKAIAPEKLLLVARAHLTGDEWARGGFRVVAIGWMVAAVAVPFYRSHIGAGVMAGCDRPIAAFAAELALAACGVAFALLGANRVITKTLALLGTASVGALWLPAAFVLPTVFTAVCEN
jgi:hypothetical protein